MPHSPRVWGDALKGLGFTSIVLEASSAFQRANDGLRSASREMTSLRIS
jgi:hypothetical protein